MKERAALKKQVNDLYAGPREEFVAARDALAKSLRADGKAAEADYVHGLAKPTVAAAVLNRVAWENPKDVREFARFAALLRRASGRAKGEKLKAAAKAERDAAARVVALADEKLAADGAGAPATRDRVIETLQAAAADPDLQQLIVAGRLDKERTIASVGFAMEAAPAEGGEEAAPEKPKEPTAAQRRKAERAKAAARKKAIAAEKALVKAQKAKDATAGKVADAERALEAARETDRAAAAKVLEAEQHLQDRERELADA
jgi:hypothetical protein